MISDVYLSHTFNVRSSEADAKFPLWSSRTYVTAWVWPSKTRNSYPWIGSHILIVVSIEPLSILPFESLSTNYTLSSWILLSVFLSSYASGSFITWLLDTLVFLPRRVCTFWSFNAPSTIPFSTASISAPSYFTTSSANSLLTVN